MKRHLVWLIPSFVALAALISALFTVDETEIAIVSRFGNPIRVIDQPGLKIKLPSPFETVYKFDKRIMVFESRPSEYLTGDKKNIVVESFACWRIADARRFLQTVKNRSGAEIRLGDMINSQLGAMLGTVPLNSLISPDPNAVKTDEINRKLTEICAKKALENYGIEVVSVRLKRLNFPQQNKASVFNRMRSERERIAKKYRAEGKEQAAKIRAETDKQVSAILSAAYRDAERIKGEGDAEAARIYAEAYSKDAEFYKLTRTLESYKKFLDEQTTIVLSSDAELLRLLNRGAGK